MGSGAGRNGADRQGPALIVACLFVTACSLLLTAGSVSWPVFHPPQTTLAPVSDRVTRDSSLAGPIELSPVACGEAEESARASVTPASQTVVRRGQPAEPARAPEPEQAFDIVIDVQQLRLTLRVDGEPEQEYPVAIGRWTTPTPIGEFVITEKAYAPGGPFGAAWLGLNVPWGSYGIHGTNRPGSIGRSASAGCIRMHNHHVMELFDRVPLKTTVIIKGFEPVAQVLRRLDAGMTGRDVQYVQHRLRQAGFDPGRLDGRYGDETRQAVRRLQRYYDLQVTGAVAGDELYVLGIR